MTKVFAMMIFRPAIEMVLKTFLLLVIVLGTVGVGARADQSIDVSDAWIRHLPGDRPMAGYFVLSNNGDKDRRLSGAASEAFARIHMHQSIEKDGTTSMRPVSSVPIPAGGEVVFEPGGYHLMLMQRREDLDVGDRVAVTLKLDDGSEKSTEFTIKPAWHE